MFQDDLEDDKDELEGEDTEGGEDLEDGMGTEETPEEDAAL